MCVCEWPQVSGWHKAAEHQSGRSWVKAKRNSGSTQGQRDNRTGNRKPHTCLRQQLLRDATAAIYIHLELD